MGVRPKGNLLFWLRREGGGNARPEGSDRDVRWGCGAAFFGAGRRLLRFGTENIPNLIKIHLLITNQCDMIMDE